MSAAPVALDLGSDLGSDLALRRRYLPHGIEHPAKLHLGLLLHLVESHTAPGEIIADPMIGIGGTAAAALLQRHVIGREIEPRWLAAAHENAAHILRAAGLFAGTIQLGQADAREPWGYSCDVALFSPPYGCRAASNANARVGTLPHRIRALDTGSMGARWQQFLANQTPGADGALRFHYGQHPAQLGHLRGQRYWTAMEAVYRQAHAAIRPGGQLILVLKDHVRDGQRIYTCDQTVALCEALGFTLTHRHSRRVSPLSLWQRRRKEQCLAVVEEEDALVFRKES